MRASKARLHPSETLRNKRLKRLHKQELSASGASHRTHGCRLQRRSPSDPNERWNSLPPYPARSTTTPNPAAQNTTQASDKSPQPCDAAMSRSCAQAPDVTHPSHFAPVQSHPTAQPHLPCAPLFPSNIRTPPPLNSLRTVFGAPPAVSARTSSGLRASPLASCPGPTPPSKRAPDRFR